MYKIRVLATILIKNNRVVQSICFKKYLPVADVVITVDFLNKWGIDEIVIFDIDATGEHRLPNMDLLEQIAKVNSVPITIAGGIKSVDDMKLIIKKCADKICLNEILFDHPKTITHGSNVFGSQCMVACIDVYRDKNKRCHVYRKGASENTFRDPLEWALELQALGAGEIIIQSINEDGRKQGYDLELVNQLSTSLAIPVVALGGVGMPSHFYDGITKGKASAVGAGNFFHFIEHSPVIVKKYLSERGIAVRCDTTINYNLHPITENGRLARVSSSHLKSLRFVQHIEETI